MIDLRELIQKISQAKDKLELQNIKSQFLGKNSQINQEFKKLGSLSEEEKKIKASSLNNEKQKITEAREMLVEALKTNGLDPLPTSTNFIFANLGSLNAEKFRAQMEKEKVLVRGIYRDYTNWSRVSTGKIKDVSQYIKALPKVIDKIS